MVMVVPGSILATLFLSKYVAVAEGVLGLVVLAILRYAFARRLPRCAPPRAPITAEPHVLLRKERATLFNERVNEDELMAAMRKGGVGDHQDIAAVLLESDGSFRVISNSAAGDAPAMPTGNGDIF